MSWSSESLLAVEEKPVPTSEANWIQAERRRCHRMGVPTRSHSHKLHADASVMWAACPGWPHRWNCPGLCHHLRALQHRGRVCGTGTMTSLPSHAGLSAPPVTKSLSEFPINQVLSASFNWNRPAGTSGRIMEISGRKVKNKTHNKNNSK